MVRLMGILYAHTVISPRVGNGANAGGNHAGSAASAAPEGARRRNRSIPHNSGNNFKYDPTTSNDGGGTDGSGIAAQLPSCPAEVAAAALEAKN